MKKSTQELVKALEEIQSHIPPNSTWRHYKGGVYKVEDYTIDTDNGKVRVLYYKIAGPNYSVADTSISFARPAEEWFTDTEAEPGKFVPRFKRVKQVKQWLSLDEIEDSAPVV